VVRCVAVGTVVLFSTLKLCNSYIASATYYYVIMNPFNNVVLVLVVTLCTMRYVTTNRRTYHEMFDMGESTWQITKPVALERCSYARRIRKQFYNYNDVEHWSDVNILSRLCHMLLFNLPLVHILS